MKKKAYLTPEIETSFLAYEDTMYQFSFEGSGSDSDDSEDFGRIWG